VTTTLDIISTIVTAVVAFLVGLQVGRRKR
jgi:hypothetical protein